MFNKKKIGILDYGSGCNLTSISSALKLLGCKAEIISEVGTQDYLILPGVGSFLTTSKLLSRSSDTILEYSKSRKILGICLGMQLLTESGEEGYASKGLGLINGKTELLEASLLPNYGWLEVRNIKNSILLKGLSSEKFYFMHSFAIKKSNDAKAISNYGNKEFVSVVENGNIFGVQFHPENSKDQGLEVFKNFFLS